MQISLRALFWWAFFLCYTKYFTCFIHEKRSKNTYRWKSQYANQFRRYVKMDSSKISLFTSVVGNGATWGKLELKIKVKKKKIQRILNFVLVSNLPQSSLYFLLLRTLFYIYKKTFSKNFYEYIRRENLSNKIVWNYSKIMIDFEMKKMLPLTKKELKSHKDAKQCYICGKLGNFTIKTCW